MNDPQRIVAIICLTVLGAAGMVAATVGDAGDAAWTIVGAAVGAIAGVLVPRGA